MFNLKQTMFFMILVCWLNFATGRVKIFRSNMREIMVQITCLMQKR